MTTHDNLKTRLLANIDFGYDEQMGATIYDRRNHDGEEAVARIEELEAALREAANGFSAVNVLMTTLTGRSSVMVETCEERARAILPPSEPSQ